MKQYLIDAILMNQISEQASLSNEEFVQAYPKHVQELPPGAKVLTREQVETVLMKVEQAQDYKDGPRYTCNHIELLDELFGEEDDK